MAVSLQKGQKVDLTKTNPGLKAVMVGLGWDTNQYDGGHAFDLDASAFLVGDNDQVTSDKDFIFFNNTEHPSGSVKHMGDNLTGEGDGDDEQVYLDLSLIPENISKVVFSVTIFEAEIRCQNFGQVSNSFIRVVNVDNSEELIRYDLGEDFSIETAIVIGELYRHNSQWKFNAVGSGFSGGLQQLCQTYGINVG